MSEDAGPFGERLRRLREAAGLTQEALAEKAGLSVQGIASLERGRSRRPYPHTVGALAEALELSAGDRAALLAAIPERMPREDEATTPTPGPDSRLPALGSPLYGRDEAIARIGGMIASGTRLVTLTGPGGVGKTTLAIHVASSLADAFPDGVAFIPLSPIVDPALLLPTIAQGLRLPGDGAAGPALETLRQQLHDARMLLVLDNLEQVIEAAPDVADLLRACEGLAVIATSRAPLRIRGEREFPVPPLAVPALDHIPQVAEVAGTAAVELFVARAMEANPAFHLEQENAASVAAICRRLEGLPLALELAAARLRVLSPLELLARLDAALPLLSDGPRDLPERQRTMTRAIAWSHDLLPEAERRLFRRLSVFRGGWTLDGAEAIGATPGQHGAGVLNSLSTLVEQSLVFISHADGMPTRYRMLQPIREFASGLMDADADAAAVRDAHARYFVELTGQAVAGLEGPGQVEWLTRLEQERTNLRAAIEWLIGSGEGELASRLGWNLWVFLWIRGSHAEAQEWMRRITEQESSAEVAARAKGVASAMAFARGDIGAATGLAEESHALFTSLGDRAGAGRACLVLGLITSARDDVQAATAWLDEAAEAFRGEGAWFWAALSVIGRGMIPYRQGHYAEAEAVLTAGDELARTAGDRFSRYIALYDMSRLAQARGDLREAARLFHEGFEFSLEVGDRANMAACLEGLASVAVMHHDPHLAARLLGRAETLIEAVGARVYTYRPDSSLRESTLASVRDQLDPEALAFEWREGAQMSLEELMGLALPLAESGRRASEPSIEPRAGAADLSLRARFGLTRRELEILRMLINHSTYRQISEELFISPRTVGTHVTAINRKLGVSSRQEAAQIAAHHGLA